MFWNTERIKRNCLKGDIISPFSPDHVKHSAYELSIGDGFYTTDLDGKRNLYKNEQFEIKPGQFAMLETKETINIPNMILGLISIKASIKFRGLINVSGFHVDPGYKGKLVFSVYNAGTQIITLEAGKPMFLLWFAELIGQTEDVYIGNSNQGITSDMVDKIKGRIASPASLDERLTKLEQRFKTGAWLSIFIGGLIITFLGAIISGIIPHFIEKIFK